MARLAVALERDLIGLAGDDDHDHELDHRVDAPEDPAAHALTVLRG
ncbi:MAG: hypothetical protein ACI9MC_001497 [Kiritimatiellia bacterium]